MQKRIKELEEALATTEAAYRESRAKCEQLQGMKSAAQGIEKDAADYLELFELTWRNDKALVLLTDLLAAYRREKERADELFGENAICEIERDQARISADDWASRYLREKERADNLHAAIILTLDENGHLADGDNCTLKALKDAVGI